MSAPRDRDQAIDRLLRQSSSAPVPEATESCLDAETLAAWADGGLSGRELEMAQSHVADCVRCQSVLAVLVHGSHEGLAAARPDVPVETASRRWFFWLAPLTAAAAAIAIWVAVPRGPASQPAQIAQVERPAPPPGAPETPPPANALQKVVPMKEEPAAAGQRDQPARGQAQTSALGKDVERRELDQVKRDAQPADAGNRADKPQAPAEAAASSAANAGAPPAAPASAARQALQDAAAFNATAVTSRWRVNATRLEQSPDGGATWTPVTTGADAELTAFSSPSGAVCWVVGRRGVVLRTTDGQDFSRIAFPEMTDLSAVRAADAQSATVTATDGRVFSTIDGGASWHSAR